MQSKAPLIIATTSRIMNSFKIHEAVEILAETGYGGIEIWAEDLEAQLKARKTSIKKIREALFKFNMAGTIHGPLTDTVSPEQPKLNITSKTKQLRDLSIKKNLAALRYADRLGLKTVVVHPGHTESPDETADSEYMKLQIESLKILALKAQKLNLFIAIELMEKRSREFVTEPGIMLGILSAVGSERAGITFDITHALTHGQEMPARFIKALSGRIVHAHFSGYSDGKRHVPFNMSTIPSSVIDRALKKLVQHYSGIITVEGHLKGIMDNTAENQKMVAAMNMEFIKRKFRALRSE